MDRYIGLDVHAASTTFAVLSATGKRVGTHVVETNGQALVEQLKTIPGKRHVVLEEGTQSAWLYEILSPHADQVVVTSVEESRGPKSDERDAFALAERLRIGAIERQVYKAVGPYAKLRELSRAHVMIVQDTVRVQNRIRALYRSRGVAPGEAGQAIYSSEGRETWQQKLPEASRAALDLLYAQYDAVQPVRREAEKQLVKESRKHSISRVLETCPGLGPIRVAQLTAIIVSPGRFRERGLRSYCGLGLVTRTTSDWTQGKDGTWDRVKKEATRGLNVNHNHRLKDIFKGAATTVITQHPDDPLHKDYERMLAAGTKPNLAKLSLARKIAAIALSMWKNQEEYDPDKHRKQKT